MLNSLAESLFVLLALILTTVWLRARGVLRPEDNPTLMRLVTELLLPALVFASISRHPMGQTSLTPALIIFSASAVTIGIAWGIGRSLRLESPRLGAFMLVAGVGSSSTLGYTIIGQVFPHNSEAVFDAVLISEIGVVIPLFVAGVPIAIHFGQQSSARDAHWQALRAFLRAPIFAAIVLGFAVSWIGLPEHAIIDVIYRFMDLLGDSLPVFVAFTIGLMLRWIRVADIWVPILLVLGLKLLLEPAVVSGLSFAGGLDPLERNILLIESAMPSGALVAIIATRYGCDGAFASALVVVSSIASLASIPLLVALSN